MMMDFASIYLPIYFITFILINMISTAIMHANQEAYTEFSAIQPTVTVAMVISNREYALPYSLRYFQNLDYPKDRMALWIRLMPSTDNSSAIVHDWLAHVQGEYHRVDMKVVDNLHDEQQPWVLRQQAMEAATAYWSDYLMMWDGDAIFTNEQTLRQMIHQNRAIVIPMLNATSNNTLGFGLNDYCERLDHTPGHYPYIQSFIAIIHSNYEGCHSVAMVPSSVLIHLRHPDSQALSWDSANGDVIGPCNDVNIVASSALRSNVNIHVLNDDTYGAATLSGYGHDSLEHKQEQMRHILLEHIVADIPLQKLPYIPVHKPKPSRLGFDQIYTINLERRLDRRRKTQACYEELGIQAKFVNAVDGRELNKTYIYDLGIRVLNGYYMPDATLGTMGRPMTLGEIGCFLSHYNIWKDIIENNHQKAIIFEDDNRFQPYFREKLRSAMEQIDALHLEWDLLYLGRRPRNHTFDVWVEGSTSLTWAAYSYSTRAHILSNSGARKLVAQQPLQKLMAVDEYIPIMTDNYWNEEWKNQFSPRDVKSLSVEPLLVFPDHYKNEGGYFSDTAFSDTINEAFSEEDICVSDHELAEFYTD